MFSSKTNRFYSFSQILITRNYAPPRGANPGINQQLKVLKDNVPQQFINDAEGFGDIETDFMDAHQTHKQYEQEIRQHKEMIQKKIIKQKYFKQKQPNFLTYAEKEQIKLLHNRDPNEWTIEKLSESFPTDLQTIKKIIKAKWIPKSEKRIIVHDERVIENWKLLKSGKFPVLHPDLVEHIQKFTNRTKEDLKNLKIDWDVRPLLPKPKNNEFLSIITSCKQKIQNDTKLLTDSEKSIVNSETINENNFKNPFVTNDDDNAKFRQVVDDEETYLTKKVTDKKLLRFQDLIKQNNLYIEGNSKDGEANNDNKVYQNSNNEENTFNYKTECFADNSNIENDLNFNIKKYDSNEVVISEADMKKFNVTPIKERIHIPRKLWKRGATYKVQDCYYDYDGEFLFRVPGMTRN